MTYQVVHTNYWKRILYGFLAGCFATLLFQQVAWWVLWHAGIAPFNAFEVSPNSFGVPLILSHAFWGGIWGILFSLIDIRFPTGSAYWIASFLFGAIFPSAVGLLIVLPLKGGLIGGGWHLPRLLTAFLSNGAWGIGTGFILTLLTGKLNWSHTR